MSSAELAQEASSLSSAANVSPGSRHGRVLIVDDLSENRLLLGLYCDQFGVRHEPAANGYEALEAAQTGRFDLILMDILMPRMDGIAATRAIRALPSPIGDIPIIAVTTAAAPGEVLRYLACGMNDVVAKPVTLARLAEAVSALLVQPARGARQKRNGARAQSAA